MQDSTKVDGIGKQNVSNLRICKKTIKHAFTNAIIFIPREACDMMISANESDFN
jgi:hypothetical protein